MAARTAFHGGVVAVLGGITMCAAVGPHAGATEWNYTNVPGTPASREAQRETWAGFETCVHGHSQSPINVVTTGEQRPSRTHLLDDKVVPDLPVVPVLPLNTGHAFQLHETSKEFTLHPNISTDGAMGTEKGSTDLRGEKYNFYQMHWHTPSENTVDGQHFDLEAHFVHQADLPYVNGTYQHLGVISVMYDNTGVCDPTLDLFWQDFPIDSVGESAHPTTVAVNLQAVLEGLLPGGFYHWMGSLTTPPCTEEVTWYMLKRRLTTCDAQVKRLKEGLRNVQNGVDINNRVTQPLYQRFVTQTDESGDYSRQKLTGTGIAGWVLFSIAAFGNIVFFLMQFKRAPSASTPLVKTILRGSAKM